VTTQYRQSCSVFSRPRVVQDTVTAKQVGRLVDPATVPCRALHVVLPLAAAGNTQCKTRISIGVRFDLSSSHPSAARLAAEKTKTGARAGAADASAGRAHIGGHVRATIADSCRRGGATQPHAAGRAHGTEPWWHVCTGRRAALRRCCASKAAYGRVAERPSRVNRQNKRPGREVAPDKPHGVRAYRAAPRCYLLVYCSVQARA
jgi:hypothetical protein